MNPSLIKEYHDLAFKEKSNFLSFINRLGEGGLKKLFKFPGEDFSLWWLSLVAEKPPYKTDCYNRLISFILSKKTGAGGLSSDKGSAKDLICFQYIMGVVEFFRFMVKIIYIKLSMGNFKARRERLSRSDCVIVSYFPSINGAAAEKNVFENQYVGPFHRSLERAAPDKYSHILIQVAIDGRGFADSVRLARRFGEKQSLFFIEEFFRVRHLFSFAYYYSYFLVKFISNLAVIKRGVIYEHEGFRYDVWRLMKRDFYGSFCGANLVSSVWYTILFKEMVRGLNDKARIVCTCEMQWWERPLYIFAKRRGLKTVGYQHSIVPELLLNYFNSEQEIGDGDLVKYCPLPDHMATVGNTLSGLFRRSGWRSDRVFVWGAQRFNGLKDMESSSVPWEERRDYIVAAFSIDTAESEKMLVMLSGAFGKGSKYKVVLKAHPAKDLRKIVGRLGIRLPSEVFSYADGNLPDAVRFAKGMIVTESSSSLYAVAHALPLIVPRFIGKIDCNPLSYITDIPKYVYSSEELAAACEGAIYFKPSADYRDKCGKIFKDYLYFPEHEDEYREKIYLLNN